MCLVRRFSHRFVIQTTHGSIFYLYRTCGNRSPTSRHQIVSLTLAHESVPARSGRGCPSEPFINHERSVFSCLRKERVSRGDRISDLRGMFNIPSVPSWRGLLIHLPSSSMISRELGVENGGLVHLCWITAVLLRADRPQTYTYTHMHTHICIHS
jgi:hypothetical protein